MRSSLLTFSPQQIYIKSDRALKRFSSVNTMESENEKYSFTISLSSTSSILEARFFPPIKLLPEKNYVLGLIEILTFHSIPNIDERNNIIKVDGNEVKIPTGSYEIEDISSYLKEEFSALGLTFSLEANNNTLQSVIKCTGQIDFRVENSVGPLLGFTPRILAVNKKETSELPVKILKVNIIRVDCNITSGAYINAQRSHTIHEFFPTVPPSFKIIETPSQVIYLPITVNQIDNIQVRLVDQDGELINFRGEVISIRLHIKSV